MRAGRLGVGGARCGGSWEWKGAVGPSRSGRDPGCRMWQARVGWWSQIPSGGSRVWKGVWMWVQGGLILDGSWRGPESPGSEWGLGGSQDWGAWGGESLGISCEELVIASLSGSGM